jgi:stromal membrane-associated protein
MGTHISRVKSVDLDIWTPDQMEVMPYHSYFSLIICSTSHTLQSIQKWGNRRANLYWESHLKSGHVPPDQYVILALQSKH